MNLSLLTDEWPFKDQTRKASKRGGERPIEGPRNDCHKYCHIFFLLAWSHAKILEGYRGIEWYRSDHDLTGDYRSDKLHGCIFSQIKVIFWEYICHVSPILSCFGASIASVS